MLIKLFKLCLKILIGTAVIAIIAITAVITLIDPNEFKNLIEQQVATRTGQVLTIHGPIHWHLIPTPAVDLHDFSVATPASLSNPFLKIKKASIEPEWRALFSGKLLVNLHLKGTQLNLTRQMIGQRSWQDLLHLLQSKLNLNAYSSFLFPYNLKIEEGSVYWQDARTNQNLKIHDLTLSAHKLSLGATGSLVPFNTKFHFEDIAKQHMGNLSFHSEWRFQETLQQLDIQNLKFIADIQGFSTSTFTGELHIQPFKSTPLIEGTIQTINFSVKKWLQLFELPSALVLPTAIDLKSSFKYQPSSLEVAAFTLHTDNEGILEGSFKSNLLDNNLKTLTFTGSFHGKNLQLGIFPLQEIKTSLDVKAGIVTFDQIQARLLSTEHQGKLQIDINNPISQFTLTDQVDIAEINELLTFLGEKDKIKGRAQIKTNLTTQGLTLVESLQNLSGQAQVSLMNGKIQGIALSSLLPHLQATIITLTDNLVKKQPVNIGAVLTAELNEWKQQAIQSQPFSTPFQLIENNFMFHQGKATSESKLSHPDYIVSGRGTLDLIQHTLDYQVNALLTHPVNSTMTLAPSLSAYFKETPLSIHIGGSLNNPVINPDLAHYAEGAIKLIQKEHPENFKDNSLEKLFGFS